MEKHFFAKRLVAQPAVEKELIAADFRMLQGYVAGGPYMLGAVDAGVNVATERV